MGGVADIFTGGPDIPDAPQIKPVFPFKSITTPAFHVGTYDSRFTLDRLTPGPDFQNAIQQLQQNQGGFLGLLPQIQGLQSQIPGLQQQAALIGAAGPQLRSQLAGTLPGLQGLFGQVGGIGQRFGGIEGQLADVQADIQPGFGRLTEAQIAQLRNREAAAAGTLRDQLAQRNLSGSSLALHEGRRLETDFAQQEALVRGEAFTRELAATRDIAALRGQILAGELGSAQEQRAIIADTRNTINNIGSLFQLDAQALSQQASLIGLSFGLTEGQANVYAQQMANIQVQANTMAQQIQAELQELGITGNIINQASSIAAQIGIQQAQLISNQAAAQGYLQSTSAGQLLGAIGGGFGLAIEGGLFGD